jgi:AraC-like DNA-binding protein
MPRADVRFSTSVFSVDVTRIGPHCNPVACVLTGRNKSITVASREEVVSGDILLIRPGVEHAVICNGGINVMYLDGLPWSGGSRLAERLQGRLADLAIDAMFRGSDAQTALRQQLVSGVTQLPPELIAVIEDLIAEPMSRMSQRELSGRLQVERTKALRMFKAATGQTFRRFKQWSGLQHAARKIASGELVRTAAMDAGFADTAHLTRTFRLSFGLTPSEAIAGLAKAWPSVVGS